VIVEAADVQDTLDWCVFSGCREKSHEKQRFHYSCLKLDKGAAHRYSFAKLLLYYALGNVRRRQTHYDEAYEIQKSCLVMFKETRGEKHYCAADAYYKLAWHLQYKGDYESAV
jgi:tetratricopeptide (TPR) repeat protein